MEQRIGPNIQPAHTAGTDPTYIPGLTSPPAAEAEETAPEDTAELPPEDTVAEDAPDEAAVSEGAEAEAAEAEVEVEGEEEGRQEVDGPVFEVSDHRGSITVDHAGVRFTLDGEEADFRWDEIGAVEVDTPRFGRRFTVTVYTSTRRWFEADTQAPTRSRLREWTAELDAALDVHFKDA